MALHIEKVGLSNKSTDHHSDRHVQYSLMQSPVERHDEENYVHTTFDMFYDIFSDNSI